MSGSLNRVELIGNLGADPDMRSTQTGMTLATLSIATSKKYKDRNNEWQEKTEWHRVVFWEIFTDAIQKYLRKGSKVFIEGELQTRSWEQDGITKYITEIRGNKIIILDRKESSGATQQTMRPEDPPRSERDAYMNKNNDEGDDDDVPF